MAMDFSQKLAQLLEGKNKSEFARSAAISRSALAKYLDRGTIPPADIALRLAHTLGVPLEWLVDDQDWPPPKERKVDANILTEHELLDAVTGVWVFSWQRLMREAEQLSRIDWAPPVKAVYHAVADGNKPPEWALKLTRRAQKFDEDVRLFRAHFDIENSARMYDFLRGKPEDECNDYAPDDLDQALGDLTLEGLFTSALNVVLIADGKDMERVKEDLKFIDTVERAVPAEGWEDAEKWAEEHPDEII